MYGSYALVRPLPGTSGVGGCGCSGLGADVPIVAGPDGSCPSGYTNVLGVCWPTGTGSSQVPSPKTCPPGTVLLADGSCQLLGQGSQPIPVPSPAPVQQCPSGQIEPFPGAGCQPIVGVNQGGVTPSPSPSPPVVSATTDKWLVPALIGGGALVLLAAVVASRPPRRAVANRRRRR